MCAKLSRLASVALCAKSQSTSTSLHYILFESYLPDCPFKINTALQCSVSTDACMTVWKLKAGENSKTLLTLLLSDRKRILKQLVQLNFHIIKHQNRLIARNRPQRITWSCAEFPNWRTKTRRSTSSLQWRTPSAHERIQTLSARLLCRRRH